MSANMQFATPPPPINLPNMSVPPPTAPNLSAPPPNLTTINTSTSSYQTNRFPQNHRDGGGGGGGGGNRGFFKPFRPYHAPKSMASSQDALQDEFDGKRLRKSVMRKTVDYNSAIIKTLENRIWQRDYRDRRALQPDVMYYPDLLPPPSYVDNPINAVTTRFVKTATNKMRCPIFCMAWTPEGRRLVTGASSGEFTLWNGLTFNFETILQAHDSPVRTMVWSHNESWMVTGDHAGYVKYWQSNMNNVKMFQAHKEAIRGLSFSPTDHKVATCSDDGTVRIWDFLRCHEERILRGHGADVKCVHWHPQKSLVISGSKDNQQPVKLWDPKTGQSLATLHAHKSTVMDVKWNENGNWLVTASRDHLLKLFDLRNLSQEVQTFRGHKKEASSVAWHPSHEGLFCSGGSDGAILFWHVGANKEVGAIEQAHDSIVWTLAWHPLGHILCSGSNDHTSKFWTRNRPGDLMRDKYNLNTLPAGMAGIDDHEVADEAAEIPGMGPEDRIMMDEELEEESSIIPVALSDDKSGGIPGLDLDHAIDESKKLASKKVPYSKPIPRNFQAQWNEMESEDPEQVDALNAIVNQLIETTPGAVPLNEVAPNAIILYGKMITVEPGSKLADAILKGNDAIQKMIADGEIEELKDVQPIIPEEIIEPEEYLQDDGDIDYTKVPDIDLPAPLPSSKFAQNPELLKSLNRGGKRKFDQLIGWTDADRAKSNLPVFGIDGNINNDTDLRYLMSKTAQDISSYLSQDEDLRRLNAMERLNRDEDLRFGSGSNSGPGRPDFDLRNAFGDCDFRHSMPPPTFNKSSMDNDNINYGEQDNNRPRVWDDDKIIGNNDLSRNNYDKRDIISTNIINSSLTIGQMGNMVGGIGTNHHNMQNISPNMPPSMVPHPSLNQMSNLQNKNNNLNMMGGGSSGGGGGGGDGPMSGQHMMHMPPNFGPNGPPPNANFNPNFRPPNGNFGPNQHFRPMGPPFGPNPGPFNNFPPNFRCPNPNNPPPNFDRSGFGSNFRNQMPGNSSGGGGGGNNSGGLFNSGFNKNYDRGGSGGSGGGGGGSGDYGSGGGNNKNNGHNRGMNRGSNDNNRSNYNNSNSNNSNNRGRGRDNDQSRGSRSRDNY